MKVITLAKVLEHIDSGQLFDIEVTSADTKRGTGGELKSYARCMKHMSQPVTGYQSKTLVKKEAAGKAANHYQNSTRNIYLTLERKVRKIHIRLITRFNGLIVT